MTNTIIKVENLSKRYRIGTKERGYKTFREAIVDGLTAPIRNFNRLNKLTKFGSNQPNHADPSDVIWALKDVSFEVKQGEVVGIIGRNGAGKTTLLKILSRITEPTSGEVKLYGRLSSLLEVGTGFHPELTGRENIYLNGAILGMRKVEINRKFDEIVGFAEIEKFIDTPVKRYSSGMYVRLAFAVAAHLEPEILLVDEVLAVGDAAFQKKCLGKMEAVAKEGRTVLFVSHQMDMIRGLCKRSILLREGGISKDGDSTEVIDSYVNEIGHKNGKAFFEIDENDHMDIQILRGRIVNSKGQEQTCFDVFEQIIFEFNYVVRKERKALLINFDLKRNGTTLFLSFDTDTDTKKLDTRQTGYYMCRVKLPCPLLKTGRYSVTTNTGIANTATFQRLEDVLTFDVMLQSRPSSLLSYAEKRPGVVAVPLSWEIADFRRS